MEDLELNLEGFAQSVKAVMKEAGRGMLTGVCGPVTKLLSVPREYAVALETALGEMCIRDSKRDFRRLWITRISAACRMNDINYSTFMNGLKKAGVTPVSYTHLRQTLFLPERALCW